MMLRLKEGSEAGGAALPSYFRAARSNRFERAFGLGPIGESKIPRKSAAASARMPPSAARSGRLAGETDGAANYKLLSISPKTLLLLTKENFWSSLQIIAQ